MVITYTQQKSKPNLQPIKLAIVQQDFFQRTSLKRLLESMQTFQEIKGYSTCEDLVKYYDSEIPDVIIIDPGEDFEDIMDSIKKVKKVLPAANLIMVIDSEGEFVFDFLPLGISGFVKRDYSNEELRKALVEAAAGGAPITSKIARMLVESFQKNPETPLTARETEVMELLSKGKSYTVIADELFIHKETVKTHIKNIYTKLKVKSKAEAIDRATRDKLI